MNLDQTDGTMVKTIPILLLGAVLGLPAGLAGARELQVDGERGDDAAGDGTVAAPFRSIGRAAALAGAGDTVLVRPGVYREAVRLQTSGTAAQPIRFVAEPAGKAIISGADVMTGWERLSGDVPIYKVPWAHVFAINRVNGRPVEHHPADAPLWGRAELVLADGQMLKPVASLEELKKGWRLHAPHRRRPDRSSFLQPPVKGFGRPFAGAFAVDTVAGKELYIWLGDGGDPASRTLEAATRQQVFGVNQFQSQAGVSHVQVSGFVFRHGATWSQRGALILHGSDNLVENCLIEDMAGGGLRVNGTVRNCVIRNCGNDGGGAIGDGCVNEGCLWEGNSWKPIRRGWHVGGFKLTRVDNGLFKQCWFRNNGGPGLWFDIDVNGALVTECVFEGNEDAGIMVEISRNVRVVENLAINNAVGHVKGGWGQGGIFLAESMGCTVVSNTCVGNKDGITFREQGPREIPGNDGRKVAFHIADNVVRQNISAANRDYQLAFWYDNSFFGMHPSEKQKFRTEADWRRDLQARGKVDYDPQAAGLQIGANFYAPGRGKSLFLYGAGWRPKSQKLDDLRAFNAATGFDGGSLMGNPAFSNVRAGNYRLHPRSPARRLNAGWAEAPTDLQVWFQSHLPSFMR